ncbi:MAG: PRC-barrel domain-containing protein [Candidatus Thermoplasmatota archaeon]|nr:PRC-barrel domain-containing protein [Candidatus Thermoplasmatota archaeon]DAC55131.1 MAG TPA: PRC-barrel domain containing protein [Candidatus Poseidoniales archaeon]DAC60064.1 MAG TPA: PRC-barrel domain containing protein [Candidatus Poseidoniales archaeon]HII22838.1 PRC-barrel domain containing protein [Candidatus Poseidoniaceae archaeon]HII50267.1 PRC-barrel domain containing protein [Candidatus Poseidoniaceae archaeon]|tara:strand:- start:2813 stop:3052 length:240 start_codon:yes stop_codon:yes gene_type:complete
MAVFAKEVMGLDVVDSHNEKLGEVTDLVIDKLSGSITQIVVILEANLEPSMLPWNYLDGRMNIPIDDVSRISNRIHLRK